eukprot:2573224-Pleurochrysis_carterae.AAC.1
MHFGRSGQQYTEAQPGSTQDKFTLPPPVCTSTEAPQTVLSHASAANTLLLFLLCLVRINEHAMPSSFQPGSTGTKGKLER